LEHASSGSYKERLFLDFFSVVVDVKNEEKGETAHLCVLFSRDPHGARIGGIGMDPGMEGLVFDCDGIQ